MPLEIVRNDITKMKTDAIVNAANPQLKMGGGVCGAIFRAAGASELQKACDKIGGCKVGKAVITEGFQLPAKYIIHTPGPIWEGGNKDEAKKLENCYLNSLRLAKEYGCESIAFPLISSGIYGYPKAEALQIATSTISRFLLEHDMNVYLVVFDKSAFQLSHQLYKNIQEYIDENYVNERKEKRRNLKSEEILDIIVHSNIQMDPDIDSFKASPSPSKKRLEDVIFQLEDTFSERVLRLIDEKGYTDVETYRRANIDRRLFSKIRSNPKYQPKKKTAIALAIALKLNLDETLDLLATAGFTLSKSNLFDVIIQFFIESGNYNIFEINQVLFEYGEETLGA